MHFNDAINRDESGISLTLQTFYVQTKPTVQPSSAKNNFCHVFMVPVSRFPREAQILTNETCIIK